MDVVWIQRSALGRAKPPKIRSEEKKTIFGSGSLCVRAWVCGCACVYLRLATQCFLLLLLDAAYLLVWHLLLNLLLLLAQCCNAIKVSLHIYLAISFVIISGISNVFLLLCVSFKWFPCKRPRTHTDPQTAQQTQMNSLDFQWHLSLSPAACGCLFVFSALSWSWL